MKLMVIAGPANSGKMPLARKLLELNPAMVMVHRDPLRAMLTNERDEAFLTLLMVDIVQALLRAGRDVLQVSQNLHPDDYKRWEACAVAYKADFWWLDTTHHAVREMIPPMAEPHYA